MTIPDSATAAQTLLAKEHIRDLMARYCRAIDRLDAELLRSVFHPDATEDHGWGAHATSAQQFQASILPYLRDGFLSTQHVLGSVLIELQPSAQTGISETYVTAYHIKPMDQEGISWMTVIGARYLDQVEERDGQWRIAHRVAVRDWQEKRVADAAPLIGPAAARDNSDPVYLLYARAKEAML